MKATTYKEFYLVLDELTRNKNNIQYNITREN